jgi:hypothetical protein
MQPSDDKIRAMLAGEYRGRFRTPPQDHRSGEKVMDVVFADPGTHGFYYREKMPDSVAAFIRADHVAALALSRGEALAKAEAENERLREALLNERVDTLWNAYHCGIERDGKWMDAAMSDAEWLRGECGIEEEGWIDAEVIKQRIPGAAAKWVKSLGGDDA